MTVKIGMLSFAHMHAYSYAACLKQIPSIDVCAAHSTRLQIAFPVRFSPPVQQLKAILDKDTLGRIYSVKTTNHGSMPGGWFVDKGLAGGGAVMDHTVHVIDLLRWFWNTKVTEVYAEEELHMSHVMRRYT